VARVSGPQSLQLLVGALSGGSFGLALAATGIHAGFLPNSATTFFLVATVGLVAGLLLTRQLCRDNKHQTSELKKGHLFSLLITLYHAGAAILFASLLVWGFDSYDQWWSGGPNRRYLLQATILGYGFLRLWILTRRIWTGLGGSDSYFFVGLIVGTFPPLLVGLREAVAFAPIIDPLARLGDLVLAVLVIPGRASAVFLPNVYWSYNPLPEQLLFLALGSLGWGFVFVAGEVLVPRLRRKTDEENTRED